MKRHHENKPEPLERTMTSRYLTLHTDSNPLERIAAAADAVANHIATAIGLAGWSNRQRGLAAITIHTAFVVVMCAVTGVMTINTFVAFGAGFLTVGPWLAPLPAATTFFIQAIVAYIPFLVVVIPFTTTLSEITGDNWARRAWTWFENIFDRRLALTATA
jgi:hypothetical protein